MSPSSHYLYDLAIFKFLFLLAKRTDFFHRLLPLSYQIFLITFRLRILFFTRLVIFLGEPEEMTLRSPGSAGID
jgi:hypothetical protein